MTCGSWQHVWLQKLPFQELKQELQDALSEAGNAIFFLKLGILLPCCLAYSLVLEVSQGDVRNASSDCGSRGLLDRAGQFLNSFKGIHISCSLFTVLGRLQTGLPILYSEVPIHFYLPDLCAMAGMLWTRDMEGLGNVFYAFAVYGWWRSYIEQFLLINVFDILKCSTLLVVLVAVAYFVLWSRSTCRLFLGGEALHPRWSGYMQGDWPLVSKSNISWIGNEVLTAELWVELRKWLVCLAMQGAIGSGEDCANAILRFFDEGKAKARLA